MPGCLTYLPSRDCVVIANSELELECYSFASLQAATDNKIEENKEALTKIFPEWKCNLGEQVGCLKVHLNRYTRQHDIVVTTDQTYFIINEKGEIRY